MTITNKSLDLSLLEVIERRDEFVLHISGVSHGLSFDTRIKIPYVVNSIRYMYLMLPIGKMEIRNAMVMPYGHGPMAGTTQEMYIGTIFTVPSGIYMTIVSYVRTEVLHGVEGIIITPDTVRGKLLRALAPDIDPLMTKMYNKTEFINTVDPLDSLSYMESQLDFLWYLAMKYIPNMSEEDKNTLKAFEPYLYYEEMEKKATEKAEFRRKQMEYIKNKYTRGT